MSHRAARSAGALLLAMSAATLSGATTTVASATVASATGSTSRLTSAAQVAAATASTPATPAGTQAGGAPAQDPALPIQMSQVRIAPAAPRAHEMLHIDGVVRAAVPFTGISVRLRVQSAVIHSRDELHLAAADTSRLADTRIAVSVPIPDIVPGVDTAWALDVPVDSLGLAFGVHRISIVVYDATLTQLGRVNTFLPYLPPGQYQPTNVAWVWPIVDAPRRDASTASVTAGSAGSSPSAAPPVTAPAATAAATPGPPGSPGSATGGAPATATGDTFLDDTLAESLAPGGRLGELVKGAADAAAQHGFVPPRLPPAPVPPVPHVRGTTRVPAPTVTPMARRPVPVTWAIDPDLLESAKAMADGYLVQTAGGVRPGSAAGAHAASGWLTAVTTAVGESPIIPLPYADADIVALARAGHSDEVRYALLAGRGADGIFRQVLSRDVTPSVVWPVNGVVTQDALDVLASAQASSVLLEGGALPMTDTDQTATPSMQGPPLPAGGGTIQPLVADTTLDQLLAADPAAADEGLAAQRFLAETAMITAEAPNRPRDILLLPPRQASNTAYLGRLLLLTGQVPWLSGITLDEALRHPVDPTSRGPLTYPDSARRQEISRGLINATSASRARLDLLRSILTRPEVLDPTERGLLRTYSASWRRDGALAAATRAGAQAIVDDYLGKVTVVHGRDPVTLLSKSAKIPLTISNGLDQTVHDIRVQVRAVNRANLDQVYADQIDIPAHDKTQRELDARVSNIGAVRFSVYVDLIAANGKGGLISTETLQVHSTGAGGVVLVVTWVLTTLLFVVVAIRLALRVRRHYTGRSHPTPVPTE